MFQGRYGNDYLNRALAFIAIGIAALNLILSLFLGSASLICRILSLLSTACIILVLVRMFSRNFEARQKENQKFLAFWASWKQKFQGASWNGGSKAKRAKTVRQTPTWEERRKYKYLICPQCAQRLRVPRGKGKLRVTCTRCGNKFQVKS